MKTFPWLLRHIKPLARANIARRQVTGALTMIDSIASPQTTGNPIPQAILTAPVVAGYNGGNSWPTFAIYEAARPDLAAKGWVVSIILALGHVGRCGDFESGGLTNSEVGSFLTNADRTHGLPWLYTFAGNSQALMNEAAAQGHPRSSYFLWSAHFGLGPHICAPNTCGFPQADGTQYTDQVAGNCDGSLIPTYMLPGSVPPVPPVPQGVDPMSVAIVSLSDDNLVALCEAQPAAPGKCGQVFQIWTTAPGGSADGGPVWHGKAGVTKNLWVSMGTPGA